ncbi:MAG: hypothetical protein KatS3mg114_0839 [Planctomycetaceae bacterium]|nr:MAG: hypothetical protein KatS3mg114_0839 [Planctomycetaceae bacterium]
MATLTTYRGLQVVTPDPTGDGGLAIQDDLKSLVDWSPKSVWAQSTDPTVSDDQTADYFPGSLWLRIDSSPPKLFVCESSATGAAVWRQILLQVVQDSTPKLGGDLDVNGQKVVSSSNGDIVVEPDGTGKVGIGAASPNTLLEVAGPIATAVATKTTNYSVTSTDSVLLCDATSGALTVTLPTAAGITGRQYSIKRISSGANTVTVAAQSGQTIDGTATRVLGTQYETVTVVSDGSNWWVV